MSQTIQTILSDSTLSAIRVGGGLDSVGCIELEEALRPFEEWTHHLIVDLSACTYLPSKGFDVLQRTDKRLKGKGGGLYLAGPFSNVLQELNSIRLRGQFSVYDTFKQAEETIRRQLSLNCPCQSWRVGQQNWKIQPFVSTNEPFLCWKDEQDVAFKELGFAIGIGRSDLSLHVAPGLFLTTGFVAGFLHSASLERFELTRVSQPEIATVSIKRALSFGRQPSGWLVQEFPVTVTMLELVTAIHENCKSGYHAFISAGFNTSKPSISCGVLLDQFQLDKMEEGCSDFLGVSELPNLGIGVWGVRFELSKMEKPTDPMALTGFLKDSLTLRTIQDIRPLQLNDTIRDMQTWIFKSTDLVDAVY